MILQPLVENSIKHGFADKVGPAAHPAAGDAPGQGMVVIEVIDNGVGIAADRLAGVMDHGIGLRNVNERLRVIYGASCQLRLHSVAGQGTSVRLEIPDLVAAERILGVTWTSRPSSSTTSSWRARSCATCWVRWAASTVVGAGGQRRRGAGADRGPTRRTWSSSTSRCPG